MVNILTVLPAAINSSALARANFAIEELNPPHNPRSAVATTNKCI